MRAEMKTMSVEMTADEGRFISEAIIGHIVRRAAKMADDGKTHDEFMAVYGKRLRYGGELTKMFNVELPPTDNQLAHMFKK